MELERFSQLYERIQFDPSILLLGQQYLSIGNDNDPVWQKLRNDTYAELNMSRRKTNYPELWDAVVEKDTDVATIMDCIATAGRGCENNAAVDAILSLRWSLLYTSAIDNTDLLVSSRGCSPVPFNERNARPQYLNKDRRYRVDLCGNHEIHPPVLRDRKSKKAFQQQIANKISWISNTYLRYYGVLIIDSLDPECDWLDDECLFSRMLEMPADSIFWFGAPEELGENATILLEDGILKVEEESFYAHIERHMPELLGSDSGDILPEYDPSLHASLTLRFNDKRTRSVYISRADISDITGANLCVIDDDILATGMLIDKSRARRFAEFLSQEGLPNWHLFDTKPDELPFYVQRDKDAELEYKLYEALKETGAARKPIILSGPSNSGKSMMLAKLALTIAGRRKHPVIFIRGDFLPGAEKRLSEFIANWFNNTDRFDSERVEKIIVIWDGSGLKRTEKDYETLQNLLFSRNAQVIGSAYTSNSPNAIKLDQDLSTKEHRALQTLLTSLGGGYIDRFNEISRSRKKAVAFKNSSLLYLLQAVFKFEFDSEYKSLSQILAKQFDQERQYAARETGESLRDYVDNFFETQKKLVQDGIASSFQEKLKLYMARMAVQEKNSEVDANSDQDAEQKQRISKLKQLSDSIEEMNGLLAVASEFGVSLPLTLLLKVLQDSQGKRYISYSEETTKIIDILKTDTLINFTNKTHPLFGDQAYVGFRNTMEAENYMCLLCELPLEDHSPKRKEHEVSLLKKIIMTVDSDAERWSAIELARQFGPNGHGMLSELENMRTRKDYSEFYDYWLDIADTVISQFPDEPEAVLLYAHLTREYIVKEPPERRSYYSDMYASVRTRLEGALRHMEDNSLTDRYLYTRLSVELCANYQQTMRTNGYNAVIHRQIKDKVRDAFRRSKSQDATELRRDFSSNSLLDILLNAYLVYKDYVKELKADDTELAQIVCDIDDMLNLDEPNLELKKINDVYGDLENAIERTASLQSKLTRMNNASFLYLQARMMWQMDEHCQKIWKDTANDNLAYMDYYGLIVGRDIPYNREIPAELYESARVIAGRVIDFLEENAEIISKTRSERCVAMLLRAKWFYKTGKPMLAEMQHVSWSRNEWDEINNLCRRYQAYHEAASHETAFREFFAPAYFLIGVYQWVYGNPKEAKEWFQKACAITRGDDQVKQMDRLVLCVEGTEIPRTFILSVQKNETRKYTAKIVRETTKIPNGPDAVANRYGMIVPDAVLKYLFDGAMPKEQQQQAKKEGGIRFNLIGARIGNPNFGGHDDER